MIKIQRNDPCPCGSGKKYKKCCLHGKAPGLKVPLRKSMLFSPTQISAISYTAEEQRSAMEKLDQFLLTPDWQGCEEESLLPFLAPYADLLKEPGNEQLLELSLEAYRFYIRFDVLFEEKKTAAENFLKTREFTPGEGSYLEMMRDTTMMLFQIEWVKPNSLGLTDLITGHQVETILPPYPKNPQKWDIIAARVVPVGLSGKPEIHGGVFQLDRLYLNNILEMVRENLAISGKIAASKERHHVYSELPSLFFQIFIQPYTSPGMMQLRT